MQIIKLTQGKEAIVDDEDYEYLNQWNWCFKSDKISSGYACRGRNPVLLMHRIILKITNSKIHIDHINGNKLDNRKENLRISTHSQNKANSKKYRNSKTKYKGTVKRPNRWQAQIRVNNKTIYLGSFLCEEEAAKAYDKAALFYFKEFANLNFKS